MADFTQATSGTAGTFPAYGTSQLRYVEANYAVAPLYTPLNYTTSFPSNAWGELGYYSIEEASPPNMFNLVSGSGGF
jgi:hypothetical protein